MNDEREYGPAMSALNERQRKFVIAMLEIPGCSYARAAREAGYSDVADGAKVRGHHAAHNPAVQLAIREEAGKRLNSLSVVAATVMMDIMLDEAGDPKTKLKAAAAVLDRTGFAAAQNINVNKHVTDDSGAAIMARIKQLAEKHGLDAQKLLGGPGPVDAEFSEVKRGEA
jgi:phage terminase small subunit